MAASTNRPTNRKIVLASHVTGLVGPEHFRIEEEPAGEPGAAFDGVGFTAVGEAGHDGGLGEDAAEVGAAGGDVGDW